MIYVVTILFSINFLVMFYLLRIKNIELNRVASKFDNLFPLVDNLVNEKKLTLEKADFKYKLELWEKEKEEMFFAFGDWIDGIGANNYPLKNELTAENLQYIMIIGNAIKKKARNNDVELIYFSDNFFDFGGADAQELKIIINRYFNDLITTAKLVNMVMYLLDNNSLNAAITLSLKE